MFALANGTTIRFLTLAGETVADFETEQALQIYDTGVPGAVISDLFQADTDARLFTADGVATVVGAQSADDEVEAGPLWAFEGSEWFLVGPINSFDPSGSMALVRATDGQVVDLPWPATRFPAVSQQEGLVGFVERGSGDTVIWDVSAGGELARASIDAAGLVPYAFTGRDLFLYSVEGGHVVTAGGATSDVEPLEANQVYRAWQEALDQLDGGLGFVDAFNASGYYVATFPSSTSLRHVDLDDAVSVDGRFDFEDGGVVVFYEGPEALFWWFVDLGVVSGSGHLAVVGYNLATGAAVRHPLADGTLARLEPTGLSPEGRLAAVLESGSGTELWIYSFDGAEPLSVDHDFGEIALVDWSPDGRFLVVAAENSMVLETGSFGIVLDEIGAATWVAWSG